MGNLPEYQKELARGMRRNETASEALLWDQLRARKLGGAKFRRQRPLGRYIADFCCDAVHPVVETDGPVHDPSDRQEYDEVRDKALAAHSYRLLRFSSHEVLSDLPSVSTKISNALESPDVSH